MTSTTSRTARIISNWTSLMEARMVMVRSVRRATSTPAAGGMRFGSNAMDAVNHVDHVCSRLALHIQDQRLPIVLPAAQLGVLGALHERRYILHPNGRTVPVGDDDVAIILGIADLVVGVDRVGTSRTIERAFGAVLVGGADGRAQIVEIESIGGQRTGIDHDPHGGPLSAADADDAHALELRDLLRDPGVRHVLDLGERHRRR